MSPSRQLALLGFICAGAALVVKTTQVTATLETRIAIQRGLQLAASNVVVQALFVTAIFALLIALITASWDRSERRYAQWRERLEAEHAEREAHARSLRVRQEIDEATKQSGPRAA